MREKRVMRCKEGRAPLEGKWYDERKVKKHEHRKRTRNNNLKGREEEKKFRFFFLLGSACIPPVPVEGAAHLRLVLGVARQRAQLIVAMSKLHMKKKRKMKGRRE